MRTPVANKRHPGITRYRRSSLSGLGDLIIGNIYEAFTGSAYAPRRLIKRATANGLPVSDLEAVLRSARNLHRLPEYLLSLSEQKLTQAIYWDDLGLRPRARENYLDSALWGIYAGLLMKDSARKEAVYQEARESYKRAAPYLSFPADPVSLNYLAQPLSAYFRLPQPDGILTETNRNLPCVLLCNNYCAPKEELHYVENSLLSQGFATLSFDYPSTGTFASSPPDLFDIHELYQSLNLFLNGRPELDNERTVLYGLGFGGRLALLLARHYPERFKAVVTLSTPLDITSTVESLVTAVAKELHISKLAAHALLDDVDRSTPLDGIIENLESSLLVVGGGKDPIALPEETREIYERASAPDKKLILCPSAGHNLYEMMPSMRHEIAQWIKQRI